MYKLAAIAVALALFAVPAALADHAEDESDVATGEIPEVTAGLYITIDEEAGTVGLWEESNDHAGLQTEVTFTEDEEEVLADSQLF